MITLEISSESSLLSVWVTLIFESFTLTSKRISTETSRFDNLSIKTKIDREFPFTKFEYSFCISHCEWTNRMRNESKAKRARAFLWGCFLISFLIFNRNVFSVLLANWCLIDYMFTHFNAEWMFICSISTLILSYSLSLLIIRLFSIF